MTDDPYAEDRTDVRTVIAAVLASRPDALALHLAVTADDASGFGFELCDVALGGDASLYDVDHAALEALADDARETLCNVRWRGVVGEDGHGYAMVPVDVDVDALPDPVVALRVSSGLARDPGPLVVAA